MLSVSRADHRALQIFVLTPGRPVAKVNWWQIAAFAEAITSPRPCLPAQLAIPRWLGVRKPSMFAGGGGHARWRSRRLRWRAIVEGVASRVGKVAHERIWQARRKYRKHVRWRSRAGRYRARRILRQSVLGSVRHWTRHRRSSTRIRRRRYEWWKRGMVWVDPRRRNGRRGSSWRRGWRHDCRHLIFGIWHSVRSMTVAPIMYVFCWATKSRVEV